MLIIGEIVFFFRIENELLGYQQGFENYFSKDCLRHGNSKVEKISMKKFSK